MYGNAAPTMTSRAVAIQDGVVTPFRTVVDIVVVSWLML
jgi:hypothetical protein